MFDGDKAEVEVGSVLGVVKRYGPAPAVEHIAKQGVVAGFRFVQCGECEAVESSGVEHDEVQALPVQTICAESPSLRIEETFVSPTAPTERIASQTS